jgi:hypothetical protein
MTEEYAIEQGSAPKPGGWKLSPITWMLLAIGLFFSLLVGLPALAYFLRASADAIDEPGQGRREEIRRKAQEKREENQGRSRERDR